MTPIEYREYRDNHIKSEIRTLFVQYPELTLEELLILVCKEAVETPSNVCEISIKYFPLSMK